MKKDIAIIGAGIVGTAIARELSCCDLSCVLLEKHNDVGAETSKANSAILHTGFDAPPGSLEARLVRDSYNEFCRIAPAMGIALEKTGALLVAWTEEEVQSLPAIVKKARENGVMDVAELSLEELYTREPDLAPGALAALEVPRESIIDPFTPVITFATQAARNGVEILCSHTLLGVRTEGGTHFLQTTGGSIEANCVINAAGLYSDEVDRLFGHEVFTVTPRKGEFIIYDKIARSLASSIILPVPTEKNERHARFTYSIWQSIGGSHRRRPKG